MEHKVCTVCDLEIEENYCTRCGQKFTDHKLSVLFLISDFLSNFFSLNKSGFSTIFRVLADPKKVTTNYSLGYRNYYSSPGNILLYGIAMITLHLLLIDKTALNFRVGDSVLSAQYGFLIAFYPFIMIVSYLSFIRKKVTFSEHLVSTLYTSTSVLILIVLMSDIIYLISGKLFEIEAFWVFMILAFFWNSRVFTAENKFKNILQNTLLQCLVFTVIVGIVLLLNLILATK